MAIDDDTKNDSDDVLKRVKKLDDGVSVIATDLIDNQPDIQQHTIDAEAAEIDAEKKSVDGLVDRYGESFDSAIHVVDKSGKPKIMASGKLRRKSGRPSIIGAKPSDTQAPQNSDTGNPREAAIATVDSLEVLGTMIASDEWAYIKSAEHGIDERARGYDVFETYYKSKNIGDIPPGIAIAIWGLCYTLPRLRLPKTKSTMSKISDWIKIKIVDRKNKQPEDKK